MSKCPSCGSDDLVQFRLNPSGQQLRFSTCRSCEHRWWENVSETTTVSLSEVLERVSAT